MILIKHEDYEYAKSFGVFDLMIMFNPDINDPLYKDCNNDFERYCIYYRINFDKFMVFDETINLDTDVLCQYNPDELWDYLGRGQPIQTLGKSKCDSHWHWNQGYNISNNVGKHIPAVHCGLIYFRQDPILIKFFDKVRESFLNYDTYGCKRLFRGSRTEEVCYSLAYAKLNLSPIDYREHPVMTFNYDKDEVIPSKKMVLIDDNNETIEMSNYIPFIHMWEKMDGVNFKTIYEKIML